MVRPRPGNIYFGRRFGEAVVLFNPRTPGFDPARRWPILIVTSTTDYHRTSPMDAEWYHPTA